MKRINRLLMIAAFSLVVLGLPAIASAQYGNGGYYPNGGYPNGNNGGYGNNGYYGDIRSTLRDLRDRAKNFEHTVDKNKNAGYNNGGWGGYGNGGYNRNSYDGLKRLLDQFTDATKNLDKRYDNGRDMNRSASDAQNVLSIGNQIDQMLYGFGNGYWQSEWSGIQNDLGIVANTYGINNRNGRNNRGNRNYPNSYPNSRNNRGNLPSWWPF